MENHSGGADPNEEGKRQEPNLDEINPEEVTPDQVKSVIDFAKTVKGQREHWKTKALDPETGKPYRDLLSEAKAQKEPEKTHNDTPPERPDEELRQDVHRLKLSEEKRQFGHANNLSPEETDHVFSYAQGMQIKPSEALQNDFMKRALEANRKAAEQASATPGSSSRRTTVEGKQFGEMKPEDRKKNWTKITGAE